MHHVSIHPMIPGLVTLVTSTALAAPPLPNDFDLAGQELSPLYAYFGGVSAWGSNLSPRTIFEGGSLEVWADLQADWAAISGFAIGTYGTSAPELDIEATADTFSVTIEAPVNGQLGFYVIIREDDNNDGVINVNTFDDQWETDTVLLAPGTTVYNFSYAKFKDTDTGAGNNLVNFNTSGKMAYMLVFETHNSYPGGHVSEPVVFNIDHVGFFTGPQSLPTRPADINADGVVNIPDLLALLSAWGVCAVCPEDINEDGSVNVPDLLILLNDWG